MSDPGPQSMNQVFAHNTLTQIAQQAQKAKHVEAVLDKLITAELREHCSVMFVGSNHISLTADSAEWLIWLKPALTDLPNQLKCTAGLETITTLRWKIRAPQLDP